MLANYGYEDGTGTYYITIDTVKCSNCETKECIKACPAGLFITEMNDWDDEVIVVNKNSCNILGIECAACKSTTNVTACLPCQEACYLKAIVHSW